MFQLPPAFDHEEAFFAAKSGVLLEGQQMLDARILCACYFHFFIGFQVSSFKIQVSGFKIQVSGFKIQVSGSMYFLPVIGLDFRELINLLIALLNFRLSL